MYLKSIEMHGFKSFAGRLVLTFNDGITGIVGPNGSGKSNVSDAVRWVLGEQSAKSLRGANMQDVIFSGTENRKALSFAYVCITLDNSDHTLPIDFDEVSVSRRIYRSGESEYQINKSNCRLKDIQELFYDTGIGKEGYSIIGQGQIERILSSKPEDRRELFDEAVGIVKYKKRKEASIKRLEEEEANLTRIEEVRSDLTERIEPLKNQSEKAKRFLKIKERQKALDINLFLLEGKKFQDELSSLKEARDNLKNSILENEKSIETQRAEYAEFSKELRLTEERLEELKKSERIASEKKGEMGSNIRLLEEKINFAKQSLRDQNEQNNNYQAEKDRLERELSDQKRELSEYEQILEKVAIRLEKARDYSKQLDDTIKALSKESEQLNKSLLDLKDERIEINTQRQKFESGAEQINIQKASISQKLLTQGAQKESINARLNGYEQTLKEAMDEHNRLSESVKKEKEKQAGLRDKLREINSQTEEKKRKLAVLESRAEGIRNMAERYEGYSASAKSVMTKAIELGGIVGVVADLIKTEKKYENAIETALGAAIQNIVTVDEKSAKNAVEYLKKNHLGRATFLPLDAIKKTSGDFSDIKSESATLGMANELVDTREEYLDVASYLLGRIVVIDTMENALIIARKYRYKYNIVTLEGEQLRPGGAITGGRFRNNSNLLGRNRELDELSEQIDTLQVEIKENDKRILDFNTAIELAEGDGEKLEKQRQEAVLTLNTAKINYDNEKKAMDSFDADAKALISEKEKLEEDAKNISIKKEEMQLLLVSSEQKQAEIEERLVQISAQIDENSYNEDTAMRALSEVQIEEANAKSDVSHTKENIARIEEEIRKLDTNASVIEKKEEDLKSEIENNKSAIEQIKQDMINSDNSFENLLKSIEDMENKKRDMHGKNAGLLDERDRLMGLQTNFEKEDIRLSNQIEKLDASMSSMRDHIWEEYELTYHNALEYKNDDMSEPSKLRSELNDITKQIREIGSVNVDAIEEYEKVREKYEFLTTQSDDLREGRQRLLDIINDLDLEMKDRFEKGFAEISKEFNKVFKELFGGGEATLKLSDNDILEGGISIIAQPPGKKLTNMMQMSGGEKALTAIAILFAILNLKPSPFCLLDEIEAALDEQNVDRFANYLGHLTQNTQFIIITHRRGTMNAADSLYGITMQEKGISTLVSVSLIENELS